MSKYCLDSNVFIEAKNGPYSFDIVPAFWDWIDVQVEKENIITSSEVYNEILDGEDKLSEWFKARKDSQLFITPAIEVQHIYQTVADHVRKNYEIAYYQTFLEKADPWVIALAKHLDAIVVTMEVLVPSISKKVKIPNICLQFGLKYINTYQMLRDLHARFIL